MAPNALSLPEIRQFMLDNGCKVTNHALVKYFKPFLTQPATQTEARKQFKTYVNILATIKNENNQKFLVLRKKYLHECPTEDMIKAALADEANVPCSPGALSLNLDAPSPYRAPPPYKPPPQVATKNIPSAAQPTATGLEVQQEHADTYGECVNEFAAAVRRIDNKSREECVEEQNKENVPRFSFSSNASSENADVTLTEQDITDNPISVKEATRKFNRLASEEEAKILSPPAKKKPEKQIFEEKELPEVTLAHPKAKEWIVAMAKASYQELAKLANEHPELVKLQDPATGTAIHWAAKHGNEDVVKLIAGTYKADVNARTNGGYTPLHLAMQFGRVNIFELLCNVYKANRDLMDWSGNKPLDYSKQRTTVSALTYSKIKARRKNTVEKDLGFLRIGSLNVRVKKTTEAFSNFLGVGNGNGNVIATSNLPHRHHHHAHHHRHRAGTTNARTHHHHYRPITATTKAEHLSMKSQKGMSNQRLGARASVPISASNFDKFHKSWGSADNLPMANATLAHTDMPPPKGVAVKKRQKSLVSSTNARCSMGSNTTDSPRDSISSSNSSSNLHSGYSSMPTTPNQLRAPLGLSMNANGRDDDTDSDSACGFGSNWSVGGRNSLSNGNLMQKPNFP